MVADLYRAEDKPLAKRQNGVDGARRSAAAHPRGSRGHKAGLRGPSGDGLQTDNEQFRSVSHPRLEK